MKKELQMRKKTDEKDSINSFHCTFGSISFQNTISKKNGFVGFNKLVNAGGSDVMEVPRTSCYLQFMEGVTLLGGGSMNPKLGEARYSDISPGIDDYC